MLGSMSVCVPLAVLSVIKGQPDHANSRVEPRGELARRIELAQERFVKGETPRFTTDFILADVALKPGYPRRFAEYSGDLSGRYIGALAMMPRETDPADLGNLVWEATRYQRADGRFGDEALAFTADAIGGDHMALLWGNGRLLVGLVEYHSTHPDEDVLEAARRLGDFLVTVQEACSSEEVVKRSEGAGAAGFICFTHLIEGLTLLYRATDAAAYLDAAKRVVPWFQTGRAKQHSHGYLTTLRAVTMLYEATGDPAYLKMVEDAYESLVTSSDYLVYGGVREYFGGKGDRDEGCSEADFLRLSLQLWRVTGKPAYLDRAERCLLNHFFANQFDTGDFGHHLIFEDGFAPWHGVGRAWWCCTMHGLRAFRDVVDAIVTLDDDTLRVNLFLDAVWSNGNTRLVLRRGVSAGQPTFTITVENAPAAECSIAVRQPAWCDGMALTLNAQPVESELRDGYKVLTRTWTQGDTITVPLEWRARLQTRDGKTLTLDDLGDKPVEAALFYGPWLLGVDEAFDPLFFGEPWRENVIALPDELQPSAPPTVRRDVDDTTESPLFIPAAHFTLDYTHGGFPDAGRVTLRPISERTTHGQATFAVWLNYRRAAR